MSQFKNQTLNCFKISTSWHEKETYLSGHYVEKSWRNQQLLRVNKRRRLWWECLARRWKVRNWCLVRARINSVCQSIGRFVGKWPILWLCARQTWTKLLEHTLLWFMMRRLTRATLNTVKTFQVNRLYFPWWTYKNSLSKTRPMLFTDTKTNVPLILEEVSFILGTNPTKTTNAILMWINPTTTALHTQSWTKLLI